MAGIVLGLATQILAGLVVLAVPTLTRAVLETPTALVGPLTWSEAARAVAVSWLVLLRLRRRLGDLDLVTASWHALAYGAGAAFLAALFALAGGSDAAPVLVEVVVVIVGSLAAVPLVASRTGWSART